MAKKSEVSVPKVGQDIYIRGAMYMSHGEDDYEGGLAKVTEVKKEKYGVFVSVKEVPGHSWNWDCLVEEQAQLKKEYKKKRAHPDPDTRPEFNRWG